MKRALLFEKINLAQKVLQAIVLRKRFPLVVTWHLTYRCNAQCRYCGSWEQRTDELNTEAILDIIDELAVLGTKYIKFSGGEVLLRHDLGSIVNFCRKKNMYVLVNSNGVLIKKKFAKLKNINKLQLSLDGPRCIHDVIRGEGTHDSVIHAIELCRRNGVEVDITTVISKYNALSLPYLLGIAEKYRVGIHFQPVDQNLSGNSSRDIHRLFAPDEHIYRETINFLIGKKLNGYKFIENSLAGLKHLYQWPRSKAINCFASRIFCNIEPDGKIFICDMFPNYRNYLTAIGRTFGETFTKLSLPHSCQGCWSGMMVELNLLRNLEPQSLVKMWRRYR